jgi:hypothetical protein
MSSRGFLGAGDVYARFYDPILATFGDWQGPFETDKFEIKVSSDLKEMTSKGKTTYGQVIESVTIPKPNDFAIDFTEVNRASMATALAGTITTFSQSAGTITDQALTAKYDVWLPLGKENFAKTGFTVKDNAGTNTYDEGVDYQMNWRLGWIKILSTGTITAAEALKITGSYNATSGSEIAGATQSQIRAQFRLDGINFADQLPVIVDCLEAVIAPDAAFDFLQNDFAKVPLKGRLKTPVGSQEPFTVKLYDTAS